MIQKAQNRNSYARQGVAASAYCEGGFWGSLSKILNPVAAGSSPARCFVAMIVLAMLSGCGSHKQSSSKQETRVSEYATTPLEVPPEKPNPQPTADSVAGATNEATAAQSDVRQVIAMGQGNPAAQGAMSALGSADLHITNALAKLKDAQQQLAALTQQLDANAKAYKQREDTMQSDLNRLKTAATSDATQSSKQIAALEAENLQLKDAQLNSIRKWLYAIGTLLCFGGVAMLVLRFYIGFTPGPMLSAFMVPTGMGIIGFAGLLPKIQEWAEYGLMGALGIGVVAIVWALGHALQHQAPAVKAGAK